MNSGGYLQFADIDFTPRCDDGTMPDDTIFKTWERTANAFVEISRRRFFNAKENRKEIEDAGFVEVEEKRYKLPLSAWSSDTRYREIGRVSSIFPEASPPPKKKKQLELITSDVVVWEILGDGHGRMAYATCDGVS
jgi:hypothetical protein